MVCLHSNWWDDVGGNEAIVKEEQGDGKWKIQKMLP
jgi:hypothetical protein